LWLNIFTITEEKIKKFLKNRKRWEKKRNTSPLRAILGYCGASKTGEFGGDQAVAESL
jgi:hypothetical protein